MSKIDIRAVKQKGYSLRYIKNQTEEICLEAISENKWAIEFVKNPTTAICIKVISLYERDIDIARQEVKGHLSQSDIDAVWKVRYLTNETEKLLITLVGNSNSLIDFIEDPFMKYKIIEKLSLKT